MAHADRRLFWSQIRPILALFLPMLRTWRIGGWLALLLGSSTVSSGFLVWESLQRGEFISALAAQDQGRFQRSLLIFMGILLASALLLSITAFLRDTVGLRWRQSFTHELLKTYLQQRRFDRIVSSPDIDGLDNPDQRISEDIRVASQLSFTLLVIGVEAGVQLVGFVGVLWSISRMLTGFLAVYTLVGTAIAVLFLGRRLTRINARQLQQEADFRFGLIHLREQGEAIAFYQGQAYEGGVLERQFTGVVANFKRLIRWQLGLDFFQNGYQYLTFILPSLILAPSILAGQLDVVAIVQSQAAFDRIWLSLSLIVVQFEQFTVLAASLGRLKQLTQVMARLGQPPSAPQIEPHTSLRVEQLTLYRLGHKCLCRELSFAVPVGTNLLVTGISGVGKSTLLKTLAGVWTEAEGAIQIPPDSLFLPQQPYLPLGSLRRQLQYPGDGFARSEDELAQILAQVQLPNLAQTPLDTVDDWSQRLSLGEQQRLSVARLLIQRPTYALLDEATSAVTVDQERWLYSRLAEAGITTVSVGHRSSLLPYQHQVLTLNPDQSWCLQDAREYRFE
ncbi:MAG: ABC transporter ATP-binding protein/permease [Leptolyngbyaceae cyanobacterium]